MKHFRSSEQEHLSPACSGGGSQGIKRLDWNWPSLSWTGARGGGSRDTANKTPPPELLFQWVGVTPRKALG